jgi:hypothetical protein
MEIIDTERLEVKRNTHLGLGIDEVEIYNYNGVHNFPKGVHVKMTCQEAMDLGVRLIRASRHNYKE